MMDKNTRMERKVTYDREQRVKEQHTKARDQVLIKEQKTTIKPPYDPLPYSVT